MPTARITSPATPQRSSAPDPTAITPRRRQAGPRTGGSWLAGLVGTVVLVALIAFVLENTDPVDVQFLGMEATVPLAVALVVVGAGVGLVALLLDRARAGRERRRHSQDEPFPPWSRA